MADIVISGNTSGSVTLRAPDIAGSPILTLPTTSGTIVTTGSASSLTTSGNLTFTGTGNRITGDFSNATLANRVAIQDSTVNGATGAFVLPNGTATASSWSVYNNSNPTNSGFGGIRIDASEFQVRSGITGTGTYLPLTMYTGGSERLRIDTSGNVGIGTSSPSSRLDVSGVISLQGTTLPSAGTARIFSRTSDSSFYLQSATSGSINLLDGSQNTMSVFGSSTVQFMTGNTERMRITSAGELLVGSTSLSGARVMISATAVGGRTLFLNKGTGDTTDYFIVADTTTANRFLLAGTGDIGTAGAIRIGSASLPTSGIGIQFPATQSASSDANTLDDYEEGTWTATVATGFTSTPTVTGYYTKVGRAVTLNVNLQLGVVTNNGAAITITGVPFTPAYRVSVGMTGAQRVNFTGSNVQYWTLDTDATLYLYEVVTASATVNGLTSSASGNQPSLGALTITYFV